MDIYSIPGIELDANEILRRESILKQQTALKIRFSTVSKACESLEKGSWTKRKEAMTSLVFHGAKREALHYALAEKQAPVVVDIACAYLTPVPAELILHRLAMNRLAWRDVLHWVIPRTNYLHLESEITSYVTNRRGKLLARDISAFGAAYFCSTGKIVKCYERIDRLRSYAGAIERGRDKVDQPDYTGVAVAPDREFDGPSERAIAALVTLRRIGAPVDIPYVLDLRSQVNEVSGYRADEAWQSLTWVMFDAGDDSVADELLHQESLSGQYLHMDIAATFLKRKDFSQFDLVIEKFFKKPDPFYFSHWPVSDVYVNPAWFCHWPVTDAILNRRFQSHGRSYVWDEGFEGYCHGRDMGLAPPPWWVWQSEWTLSKYGQQFFGKLT